MNKRNWNTYKITCYTHDVANDQSSAGGIHQHQVRHTKDGWQYRIVQVNTACKAIGPVTAIDDEKGAAAYATAQSLAKDERFQ